MLKPQKCIKEYYDYIELKEYLKQKHNIGEYFWDWLFRQWDFTPNGVFRTLCIDEDLSEDAYTKPPENIKKVLQILKDEFEGEMEIYIWW